MNLASMQAGFYIFSTYRKVFTKQKLPVSQRENKWPRILAGSFKSPLLLETKSSEEGSTVSW